MKPTLIHINLIREEELRSSLPIRTRILIPILGGLALLGVALWALMLIAANTMLRDNIERDNAQIANLEKNAAYHAELDKNIANRKKELDQLDRFLAAQVKFGRFLEIVAEEFPESAELQRFAINPAPDMPPARPGAKAPPPQGATILMNGLVYQETGLDAFLDSLQNGEATNSIVSADFPPNSFGLEARGTYHYTIRCIAKPRLFEIPKTKKAQP